jgi:hypothetical protein
VLYFFTENGVDVAENEWLSTYQANPNDGALLIARANRVALAPDPAREARPDLYDHNTGLWLYASGAHEMFYGIRPGPSGDDVIIIGCASTAGRTAALDAEMHRRATLI